MKTVDLEEAKRWQGTSRREFIDPRVRSEPKPRFAANLPSILDGDCAKWVGMEPPAVPFVIGGLVPEGMLTLLVSHGGTGKTMLSQTAMTCIPCGLPLYGRETAGGNTAGVFAEDPAGVLHARQCRINEALGVDMEQLAGRAFPQSYAGMDACLWRGGKTTPFFDKLESDLRRIPDLRLCAIDNVALVFADNENDRIAATGFINALNGMAARLGCGIILSTHTSKSTEEGGNRIASGSTGWVNASRSVITLKADETNPDRVTLKLVKANHAKRGDEIALLWKDGVLGLEVQNAGGVFGQIQRRNAERAFLDGLQALAGAGKRVNSKRNTPNFAPRIIAQMDAAAGFSERDLNRAMLRLLEGKQICEVEDGPASRRRAFLEIIEAGEEGKHA